MSGVVALVVSAVALTLWAATAAATAYVLWRYAFTPWRAMRADVQALHAEFAALRQYVESVTAPRRAEMKTDEEIAFVEQRLAARAKARIGSSPGHGAVR